MLVTKCPRCGRPTPARLASPNAILCATCGYDGPPTPDAVPTLRAAREFLFSRNTLDRQITDVRARALSQNAQLMFGALFVVACLPCTFSFLWLVSTMADACGGIERYGAAVLGSLPLVGLCWYGLRGLSKVERAQHDLRAASAALPPERKGDPARCRICGGPLPAGDAVVRCPFCAADNYSDLDIISKLAERQSHDAVEYEFAVARAESTVESVTFDQQKRAFLRGLGVWFLAGYPALAVTQLVAQIKLPTRYSGRYAFVMSAAGQCLARSDTGSDLAAMVGKNVHTRGGVNPGGVVTRVYSSFFGSFAVVVDVDGSTANVDPFSLCLDASPTPPER